MGYESLHIRELLSVQCNDVIHILSPVLYFGFGRCGSQRFALIFDVCIKSKLWISARQKYRDYIINL